MPIAPPFAIPAAVSAIGAACLLAFTLIGGRVDGTGALHEPTELLALGLALVGMGAAWALAEALQLLLAARRGRSSDRDGGATRGR